MRIYISWSKRKSMEYAILTKTLLEELLPNSEIFMSEVDIIAGEDVQSKIISNIENCDKLILCYTKENKKSPWLLYEAGYAKGNKKQVIPLLFDDDFMWHSWIDNPMNIAREIKFNNENFLKSLIDSLSIQHTPIITDKIFEYKKAIFEIKERYRLVDEDCEDIVDLLIGNEAFTLENPQFRDKTAYFITGFESFDLYKTIIKSFLYTGKYLWIYGRKNMKLFGGNFNNLFEYLNDKTCVEKSGMDGIDFKCLFLDPHSKEVSRAHKNQIIFKSELNTTILRAKNLIGDNDELQRCFRYSSSRRDEVIIRVDNSIIYSKANFDSNGFPQILTNTSFEVFSVDSVKGKRCTQKFKRVWDDSINIF